MSLQNIQLFITFIALLKFATEARLYTENSFTKYQSPHEIQVQHTTGFIQLQHLGQITTAADLVQVRLHFKPETELKQTWTLSKDTQKLVEQLRGHAKAPAAELEVTQKLSEKVCKMVESTALLLRLPTKKWMSYRPSARSSYLMEAGWAGAWRKSPHNNGEQKQKTRSYKSSRPQSVPSRRSPSPAASSTAAASPRPKRQAFLAAIGIIAAASLWGTMAMTLPTLSTTSRSESSATRSTARRLTTLEALGSDVAEALDKVQAVLLFEAELQTVHSKLADVNTQLQATITELGSVEAAVVALLGHRLHPAIVTPAEAILLVQTSALKARARGYTSLVDTAADIYQSDVDFLIMEDGSWQLFLQLPVYKDHSVHELYLFKQAIFTHNDSNMAGKHTFSTTPEHLLIAESENNIYFRVFKDLHAISHCPNINGLRLCYNDDFAHSHFNHSCIKSMLRNETDNIAKHCDTHLLRNEPAVYKLNPNSVLFYEPEWTDLNLECWTDGTPVTRKSRKIRGLNRIDLPDFCRAFSFHSSFSSQSPILIEQNIKLHPFSFESLQWPGLPGELSEALVALHNSTLRSVSLAKIIEQRREHFRAWQHSKVGTVGLSFGMVVTLLILIASTAMVAYILYKHHRGFQPAIWFRA
jgi:hypothetical protein